MPACRSLSGLKASQLKHAALLVGLPTTGTKSELAKLIQRRIDEPVSFRKARKIVSVDMGIKNLGICVLEASHLATHAKSNHGVKPQNGNKPLLKVLDWKKVDVLSLLSSSQRGVQNSAAAEPHSADRVSGESWQKGKAQQSISAETFRPSNLSKAAITIAQDLVHNYNPTHILIERQRFRSGGASAVQEWTLRVNMLESMLWACLETMRQVSDQERSNEALKQFPVVHEVNPARVAKFWCMTPTTTGTTVPKDLFAENWIEEIVPNRTASRVTKKIEKKDKIAVVRSWLSESSSSELKGSSVALEFSNETSVVADTFLTDAKKGRPAGKLDDLADCLLQGVAWVRWEENLRKIRDMLHPPAKS